MVIDSGIRLYYSKYNPCFQLYVTRSDQGLAVYRIKDSSQLAHIFIKDFDTVAGYEWDNYSGRFISVFLTDGTIRIYDIFKNGRLVSYIRSSSQKNVDSCLWDRAEFSIPSKLQLFDSNIIECLPTLIKFVKDSRNINIIDYYPPNHSWRHVDKESQDTDKEIDFRNLLDVHIQHNPNEDNFTIILNGVYEINGIVMPDISKSEVYQLLKLHNGEYMSFYKNGHYRKINFNNLLSCNVSNGLLSNILEIRNLNRYVNDHLDLIKRELIIPYSDFVKKICIDAYAGGMTKLNDELESLLLTGEINNEFKDWLVNIIGDRNGKKWRKLGMDMFEKIVKILTLAIIPSCERFMIYLERTDGYLNGYMKTDTDFYDIISLREYFSKLIRNSITIINSLNNQLKYFEIFSEWINDKINEITDEDYKNRVL
ncbi:hypothetical protein Kpol_392p1, partial [Vanderwaltozyma polyspora DSM 70294]